MGALEEQLLNTNVVMMAAAAWFIMWVLRKIIPQMQTNTWIKRFKPLYPAVLCQGLVWIPGALPDDSTIASRILMGFWCGFLASIGYQLIRRFLGAKGIELPEDPNTLVPATSDGASSEDEDSLNDDEALKAKAREEAVTPIETLIPKGDTPEDGDGAGDEGEAESADGDDDNKPGGAA